MTAKEKADELVNKFYQNITADSAYPDYHAKEAALIAVDEIVKQLASLDECTLWDNKKNTSIYVSEIIEYWQQIKIEIEKL